MSTESGHVVMNVYVKSPLKSGISFGEIEKLIDEVSETAPKFRGLRAALSEVLDLAEQHSDLVTKFRSQDRFLLGISARGSVVRQYELGGLFYAEGLQPSQDGAFSVVRMGAWISAARVPEEKREDLRQLLIDSSLNNIEDRPSGLGVPINSNTFMIKVYEQALLDPVVEI